MISTVLQGRGKKGNELDEFSHLGEIKLSHLLNTQPSLLHRICNSHSLVTSYQRLLRVGKKKGVERTNLEISPVMDNSTSDVDQRIVRRRVELHLQDSVRADQIRDKRTDPLQRKVSQRRVQR